MPQKKVLAAMSGGVDSSVAAALLVEQGYEVFGVTLKLHAQSSRAIEDAAKTAQTLGIPHQVINLSKEFYEKVISYFIDQYSHGNTPNPCVVCNKYIKFGLLMEKALAMGMEYITTGHYAAVEYDDHHGRWLLKKSKSSHKDQTYVLYNLTQEQMKHILFPMGEFRDKDQVRQIARKLNIEAAERPESQEICFITHQTYGEYILKLRPELGKKGLIVDTRGKVLGEHDGVINYTIGQRKGIGVAFGRPMYVVGLDAGNNRVIVGEEADLYSSELTASDVNYISFDVPEGEMRVTAKIRYGAKEVDAVILPLEGSRARVRFSTPQKAVTPGQSVVLYKNDLVVGGGIIEQLPGF